MEVAIFLPLLRSRLWAVSQAGIRRLPRLVPGAMGAGQCSLLAPVLTGATPSLFCTKTQDVEPAASPSWRLMVSDGLGLSVC